MLFRSTSAGPSQPPPLLLSQPSGNKAPAADLPGGPPPDGPPNDGPPSDKEPLDYVLSDGERSLPHPASPEAEQLNLAKAIVLMTQELKHRDHKKKSSKAKEPDTFDGSDSKNSIPSFYNVNYLSLTMITTPMTTPRSLSLFHISEALHLNSLSPLSLTVFSDI